MITLTPVDHDPFGDYNPFKTGDKKKPAITLTPVDYNPFTETKEERGARQKVPTHTQTTGSSINKESLADIANAARLQSVQETPIEGAPSFMGDFAVPAIKKVFPVIGAIADDVTAPEKEASFIKDFILPTAKKVFPVAGKVIEDYSGGPKDEAFEREMQADPQLRKIQETGGGDVTEPLINPLDAAVGGGVGSAKMAYSAGKGLAQVLGRGALGASTAVATEPIIGQATEEVVNITGNEYLALPFAVGVGMTSAFTVERLIEKAVLKAVSGKNIPAKEISSLVDQTKQKVLNKQFDDPLSQKAARLVMASEQWGNSDKPVGEIVGEMKRAGATNDEINEVLDMLVDYNLKDPGGSKPLSSPAIVPSSESLPKPYKVPPAENIITPEIQKPSAPLEVARGEVNITPTEAQIKAGNYKKGHVDIQGLDISIENPKGSTRSGTDKAGTEWSVRMNHDYGYIKNSKGADKENVDVYLGPDLESNQVFVVHQVDPKTRKYDEDKVMVGFKSQKEAEAAYRSQYDQGEATKPDRIGIVTPMSMDQFKQKISKGGPLMKEAVIRLKKRALKVSRQLDKETKPQAITRGAVEAQTPDMTPGDIAAGGLAYGQKLPKKAGNINLDRIGATYPVKKLILDTSDQYKGHIDETKRGVVTHEETKKLADDLGLTIEQLLKRRKGQAFNAEESLAARNILNTSTVELRKLQRKAAKTGSDEDMALFKLAFERHALIEGEVSGVAAEAGRTLSAHRIKSAKNRQVQKNYKAMLETLGGREMTDDILDKLSKIDPDNQVAVNTFIRDASKAKTPDMVFEAWVNGLLSGPQTHVVNATSNSLTFLTGLAEKSTGAGIDFFRAGITKTPRERYFGELPHNVYGAWQGMKEGVRKGMEVFLNEMPSEIGKLDIRPEKYGAIPSKTIKVGGKEIQVGGKQVRIPGRLLMASDAFFKAVNYQSELHGMAFRQAAMEGKKGKPRASRIAEILSNPTEELKLKATEEALYRVFQKDLGEPGKAMVKLRDKVPGLRYIIPFLKTPINIAKYGLERTPMNFPLVFKKMMKGELKGGDASAELAKPLMGSLIGATAFMYAKEGLITGGGPRDRNERAALYRAGWQPYSIKVGDTYYSYGRLEPLGMVLGLSADAAEIWDTYDNKGKESIASLIAVSVGQNLLNKTFMRGLSDAFKAVSDPGRYGERWTQRFAGTLIPTGVATFTRAIDPILKKPENHLEALMRRAPGLSDNVLPRRDLWGQPIKIGEGGFMERLLSPVYRSKVSDDKVDNEIVRMGLKIGLPTATIKRVKLTPEEYDQYVKLSGERSKKRLDSLVALPDYEKISGKGKEYRIKQIIKHERNAVANEIYKMIPAKRRQEARQ
jgi:hypothetical protein